MYILKVFLLVLLILISKDSNAQDTPKLIAISKGAAQSTQKRLVGSKYYYKISGYESNYNCKIIQIKSKYFFLYYNDSNRLLSKIECIPEFSYNITFIGNPGDTIDDIGDGYYKYFKDTILPIGETYTNINWHWHGKYESFLFNGKVETYGQYYMNEKDGKWYYFDKNGTLTRKEKYRKGKLISSKSIH